MNAEKDNHAKHLLRRMDNDMLADAAAALIRRLERLMLDDDTLKAMLHLKGVLTLCGHAKIGRYDHGRADRDGADV